MRLALAIVLVLACILPAHAKKGVTRSRELLTEVTRLDDVAIAIGISERLSHTITLPAGLEITWESFMGGPRALGPDVSVVADTVVCGQRLARGTIATLSFAPTPIELCDAGRAVLPVLTWEPTGELAIDGRHVGPGPITIGCGWDLSAPGPVELRAARLSRDATVGAVRYVGGTRFVFHRRDAGGGPCTVWPEHDVALGGLTFPSATTNAIDLDPAGRPIAVRYNVTSEVDGGTYETIDRLAEILPGIWAQSSKLNMDDLRALVTPALDPGESARVCGVPIQLAQRARMQAFSLGEGPDEERFVGWTPPGDALVLGVPLSGGEEAMLACRRGRAAMLVRATLATRFTTRGIVWPRGTSLRWRTGDSALLHATLGDDLTVSAIELPRGARVTVGRDGDLRVVEHHAPIRVQGRACAVFTLRDGRLTSCDSELIRPE